MSGERLSPESDLEGTAIHADPGGPGAGDSREQREAEAIMVQALSRDLGIGLAARRILLAEGGRLELDAASRDLSILCEAWAHQGPPKSAQKMKVLTDAFKLAFAADVVGGILG